MYIKNCIDAVVAILNTSIPFMGIQVPLYVILLFLLFGSLLGMLIGGLLK